MVEPKLTVSTFTLSFFLAKTAPDVSKEFANFLLTSPNAREKAKISRIEVAIFSAVSLFTLVSTVLYDTPAKVRSLRIY